MFEIRNRSRSEITYSLERYGGEWMNESAVCDVMLPLGILRFQQNTKSLDLVGDWLQNNRGYWKDLWRIYTLPCQPPIFVILEMNPIIILNMA